MATAFGMVSVDSILMEVLSAVLMMGQPNPWKAQKDNFLFKRCALRFYKRDKVRDFH